MMNIGSSIGIAAMLLSINEIENAKDTPILGNSRPRGKRIDLMKETINSVPVYHLVDNAPNNRRAKVKAARRQNVRRLIAAKHA